MSEIDSEEYWMGVDLETNGFELAGGQIYEVAAVLIDANTLEEYGRFHHLVRHEKLAAMDLSVLAMHQKSGLWDDLIAAKLGERHVVRSHSNLAYDLRSFIKSKVYERYPEANLAQRKVKLVGNSVDFDKSWLLAHCGDQLRDMISHRTINCSTLRDTLGKWYGIKFDREGSHHRAMSDVEHSLHILRTYKSYTDRLGFPMANAPTTEERKDPT